MNKKGLSRLVDIELKSRNPMGGNWDREFILNSYRKYKKQDLNYDEIIRKIVLEFEGLDEDYWKHKIERVLFSEGVVDKKSDDENEVEKATTKLTNDEYKDLLKKEDYKFKVLPKQYYEDQRDGKAFAQFHIRNILDDDKKAFDEKKISFQEMIIGHSLHSDIRWELERIKGLIQGVLVESDMESYLRVFKGEKNPEQKGTPNVQKGLFLDKPKTSEPKIVSKKESDELLLDKKGAKIVDDYIMHNKSFFLFPGSIGSKHGCRYLGIIWTGKMSTATERDDYHELFFYSDNEIPEKNQKLLNGKFIIKAFSDKAGKRYLFWKSTKEPYPANPYIHMDKGMHKILPIKSVTKFCKEDYPNFKERKEQWGNLDGET